MKRLLMLCLFPAVAFAQDAATAVPALPTDEQAPDLAGQLYNALVNKNWALALGPALTLLVWALRKWDTKIPKVGPAVDQFLNQPFVAFLLPTVLSAVGGIGTAIAAHKPPGDIIKAVFEASMSAVFVYVGLKKAGEQRDAGQAAAAAVEAGGKQAAIDELKKP